MTRSLSERLNAAAPYVPSRSVAIATTIADIDRILALPKRPPVDCERDEVTGLYPPATQALIEVMTEKFSRGQRVSCACCERRARMLEDGSLLIGRVLPEGDFPEPPTHTTVAVFVADMQKFNAADVTIASAVSSLQPGAEVTLPAADGRSHPCITVLNAVQAWFLREAMQVGGVVGFAGVGSGKSFCFLLAPLLFPDIRLASLIIEPKQRQHYRSQYLRLREHFRVPSIVFDDGNPGYTVPGTPPLHLMSYSVLSQTKNSDMLDERDPDALFLDEAHRACGISAINRRVKRFCAAKIKKREEKIQRGEPVPPRAVRLLDASGTLESKSVEDTQMLCAYSLGTGSPLPLDPDEAKRWSAVINPVRMPDRKSRTAKMLQRVFAGREFDDESFDNLFGPGPETEIREGFRERRLWTPGIISASAASINAAIYLSERKPPKMPPSVREALMKVRTEQLRPDGELLVEKVEQIATARNIACGFYQYWSFSKHPCTCEQLVTRCPECLLIDDWYRKRKAYNKELRGQLVYGERLLDTPELCRAAAERYWKKPAYAGSLPMWRCDSYPAWAEIENRVQYEEREKWIADGGDFLVNDAAAWATDNKGVVWFQSTAFGHKLAQLTKLPYFNGGPTAETRMRAEKGDRSIICSIKAHGAGTDGLQYLFNKQLICETPASNSKQSGYEQLLGRLHREGQREDEVITEGYFHVRELKDALRNAIAQAEFNFEMQKNKQKLLMADISVEGL